MAESTQNMTVRGARGGRRSGAGRPASYREPLVRKTVTLPISYVEQLTMFGAGIFPTVSARWSNSPIPATASLGSAHPAWIRSATTTNAPQTPPTPSGDMPPGSRGLDNPRRPADPFGLTTYPR
jgi:hypothetical protein